MSVIPSLFDQKCLIALKPIPAPWRVPKAAQAWQTDCVDAMEIVNRYLKNGWLLMTHPGHYRLTQSGVMAANAMLLSMSAMEKEPDLSAFSRQRMSTDEIHTLQYELLNELAREDPQTTLQLAKKLNRNQESIRRNLLHMHQKKLVRRHNGPTRFRLWYLTDAGGMALKLMTADQDT